MDETTSQMTQDAAPEMAPEPEAPQKRLMISKMVLENFKSYAGQVTIGPFDKNMTSVVGPNGSGKSNVIDSMLFVFGFKAKQMRQSKVSELIDTYHSTLAMILAPTPVSLSAFSYFFTVPS